MSIKLTKFGEIIHHKNYKGDFSWPSNDYICKEPFLHAEIRLNGDVTVCCPLWNPLVIGNVLEQDLATIWASERARAVRESVQNGEYTYCDQHNCPYIQQYEKAQGPVELKSKGTDLTLSSTPNHIHFVIDLSCNLSCPSCRNARINRMTTLEIEEALRVMRGVLDSMFSEPHNEHKELSMDGRGEVFHSEVWREIFDTHSVFQNLQNWPNLRFCFNTNGTMLTPKYQEKYRHLLERSKSITISIDAGNKESYELVRREGDWDQLWINLRALHERIKYTGISWGWNLIVQKNNYQSIPEFVKLARSFAKKPQIHYTNILDWGKLGQDYVNHAVWRPDHPDYQELQSILNQPEVKYYRC